jgi:hypothetical protein
VPTRKLKETYRMENFIKHINFINCNSYHYFRKRFTKQFTQESDLQHNISLYIHLIHKSNFREKEEVKEGRISREDEVFW